MKPIYGMFKRTLKKKNNTKSVPIVYDLEDADGWFSHKCIMNTEFLVCDGRTIEVKGTWQLLKEGK